MTLNVNEQGPQSESGQKIESLWVPKNVCLLQLNMNAIHANTTLAGAINLTRRVLKQYRAIDKNGQDYWPVGLIAECMSGGRRVMEVQYSPEEPRIRSLIKPFNRIKENDLKGDYRLIYLFLIPPGKSIVTFDAGNRPMDISYLGLVAPQ